MGLTGGHTIFALATGAPPTAIAIVRVSGPDAHAVADAICLRGRPADHRAARRRLVDPITRELIDDALVLCFPADGGFTGEPTVEFQIHGASGVYEALERALASLKVRAARPGEFTQRAFRNGRLSFHELEALGDLVSSETRAAHRHATRLLEGEPTRLAQRWRRMALELRARLEAMIDHGDDELDGDVVAESLAELVSLQKALQDERSAVVLEPQRVGHLRVVLVGPPNAGKSTLLNQIARDELALVNDVAGTTRDPVRARLSLGSKQIELIDTAGLRDAADPVETMGVARALHEKSRADLVIWTCSGDTLAQFPVADVREDKDVVFWTKSDLALPPSKFSATFKNVYRVQQGDRSATHALTDVLLRFDEGLSEISCLSGSPERLRRLEAAIEHVAGIDEIGIAQRPELAAARLNAALQEFDGLIEPVATDDVLDVIFERFCLGK